MEEISQRPIYQGLALIVIGLIFILGNFGVFNPDWGVIFTWMIMLMGVLFWIGFISDRSRDFLIMPATILLIYGIVFYMIAKYDWATIGNMGPLFILAPALGLYFMYLFGRKNRAIMVTAAVLGIVTLIFLVNSVPVHRYIWPFLTVAVGIYLIMHPEKKIHMPGEHSGR